MIERNIIHIENAGLADKVIKFISLGILGVDRIRTLKRIDNNDDRRTLTWSGRSGKLIVTQWETKIVLNHLRIGDNLTDQTN